MTADELAALRSRHAVSPQSPATLSDVLAVYEAVMAADARSLQAMAHVESLRDQSLLARTMATETEHDDPDSCSCHEVPSRHLDPDGHVPTCTRSMAYASQALITEARQEADGALAEMGEMREQTQRLRAERDALVAEVKTIAERTEAALTKRIAAWLYDESSFLASMASTREANDRNQRSSALANAADSLRAGTWKESK